MRDHRPAGRAGVLALLAAGLLAALPAPAQTLYLTHRGSGELAIMDASSLEVEALIPVGSSAWGVALTPDGRWACVSTDAGLAVVDLADTRVARRVALDGEGMGVATSADGEICYVAVHRPGPDRLVAVRRADGARRGHVDIGERAFGLYRSPAADTLFVPEHDDFTLTFVALPSLEKRHTLRLHPAGRGAYDKPHYLAMSPDGARLYLPFQGRRVAVVNVDTRRVRTYPLDVDAHQHGIATSPNGERLYIANSPLGGGGSLSVIDTGTFEELNRISVGRGHEQVAVGPDGRRVYLTGGFALGGHDALTVVNPQTREVRRISTGGSLPFHIVVRP